MAADDVDAATKDAERALALARDQPESQLVTLALAEAGLVFLRTGRQNEAAALLAQLLEYGERLVPAMNDSMITDAAWLAHDLGRGTITPH